MRIRAWGTSGWQWELDPLKIERTRMRIRAWGTSGWQWELDPLKIERTRMRIRAWGTSGWQWELDPHPGTGKGYGALARTQAET